MDGSNQDFPYWESDRTQPNGQAYSQEQQELRARLLQQQLESVSAKPPVYAPQPQPQSISLPGKGLTLTITTTAVKLDIVITPL